MNIVRNDDTVNCPACYEALLDDLEAGAIPDSPGYFNMGETKLPCDLCDRSTLDELSRV